MIRLSGRYAGQAGQYAFTRSYEASEEKLQGRVIRQGRKRVVGELGRTLN